MLITLFAGIMTPTMAEVLTGIDAEAQLPFWELRVPGMSLRLVQRLPDQTRAYFMGRGFTPAQAEPIAQSCVFQTIYKNTAPAGSPWVIQYDLKQWQVEHDGKMGKLKVREDWHGQWQQQQVKLAAAIAFEWSLLPTRQTYRANDYNWGMTSFNLPPGSHFDLQLRWQENGVVKTARMEHLECAADIHPPPN
jgi:hypothetical protein